jgi:hypothetical protein
MTNMQLLEENIVIIEIQTKVMKIVNIMVFGKLQREVMKLLPKRIQRENHPYAIPTLA